MTNYNKICTRWIDRVLGRTDRPNFSSNHKIFGSGDRLYSYGRHFELARVLRDRKGSARGFLLNGDNYSVTTARHQREIRDALASFTDLPRVIIPNSALEAADVDYDSVEIVDVTADRFEQTNHVTYEQPPGSVWREVEDHGYVDLTPEELAAKVAEHNAHYRKDWERECKWAETDEFWAKRLKPEPRTITVDDLNDWDRCVFRKLGSHMVLCRSAQSKWDTITVELLDDGRTKYSWTTSRHWLGESLVRARVKVPGQRVKCKACKGGGCDACYHRGLVRVERRPRWAFFLSGFDHHERRPVYFFCELPRGVRPTTVAEAYEALKPDAVKLAEQMGRTVLRQGDIFAIELRGTTKRDLRARGAKFEKRGNLLHTNHEATEVAYLPDGSTLVRGTLWHNPPFRDPDHRRVTVGKTWHLVCKNTVPLSK